MKLSSHAKRLSIILYAVFVAIAILHSTEVLSQGSGAHLHPLGLGEAGAPWHSSGSVFDCREGCFTDNTLVI